MRLIITGISYDTNISYKDEKKRAIPYHFTLETKEKEWIDAYACKRCPNWMSVYKSAKIWLLGSYHSNPILPKYSSPDCKHIGSPRRIPNHPSHLSHLSHLSYPSHRYKQKKRVSISEVNPKS